MTRFEFEIENVFPEKPTTRFYSNSKKKTFSFFAMVLMQKSKER